MKKQVLAVIALFVMTAGAYAQKKATEKDLQGRWNMTSFDMGGIIIDVAKNEIRFSEEISADMDQASKDALKESMAPTIDAFKSGYIEFKGNKATVFLETPDTATFALKEEAGSQYLILTYEEDKSVDDFEVLLNGKELHLFAEEDDSRVEFIYTKK
jgi:hypothetical protein